MTHEPYHVKNAREKNTDALREALAIASGQKSGTTTAETEHVRAIGRYSADLLNALIRLEDAGAVWPYILDDGIDGNYRKTLESALTFARKVIHATGGLTVAEETQLNLVKDRSPDPVEERLDDEADHA
jgi:hypothetical protein